MYCLNPCTDVGVIEDQASNSRWLWYRENRVYGLRYQEKREGKDSKYIHWLLLATLEYPQKAELDWLTMVQAGGDNFVAWINGSPVPVF
jgi:hypothetical protein